MIYDVDLLTTFLKSARINLGSSLKFLPESDLCLTTKLIKSPVPNSDVSLKLPLLSRSFRLAYWMFSLELSLLKLLLLWLPILRLYIEFAS